MDTTNSKTGNLVDHGYKGRVIGSSIIAFIAGALMISGVILGVLMFFALHDDGVMNAATLTSNTIGGVAAAAFSAGTGAVCIVGGYEIYRNPKRNKTKWGVAILVPSFIGVFILTGFPILSGFIIGPMLGIVAGLLAVARPQLHWSAMLPAPYWVKDDKK